MQEEMITLYHLRDWHGNVKQSETTNHVQQSVSQEDATRQLHQLSCILDSCTITASYEVSQAQKALLLLLRTEKGSGTSSEEYLPIYRNSLTKMSCKSTTQD